MDSNEISYLTPCIKAMFPRGHWGRVVGEPVDSKQTVGLSQTKKLSPPQLARPQVTSVLSASNAAKANFEEKICVLCEEKRPMQYDIAPVDME